MSKQRMPLLAPPMEWPRADPEALAKFNPASKVCTMNCGPSTDDPRTWQERLLLCTDCLPREALGHNA